jgi:hypothetical protein
MSHAVVLDEAGAVFDPDPKYDWRNPKPIEHYPDLIAWEIVNWE